MDSFPSASLINLAFGNSIGRRRPIYIKELYSSVAGLLRKGIEIRNDYLEKFNGKQSDESEFYNRLDRCGDLL